MEFIQFDNVAAKDWDDVIYASEDGWVFSLAGWLEMVTPVWDMENHSFAIRENGKLVAAMPLHLIPLEKRLSSEGWGHGGPAIFSEVSSQDRRRLWQACWSHTEEIAMELRVRQITASISPLTQSSLDNRWGVNPLVEVGFDDISTHTRIINLTQSEEDLWFGLAKDARQKIKRARAAGYTVRNCSWIDMIDEYYETHVENYRRTGVPPHPKPYFIGIANLAEKIASLWVGFDPDGHAIAFHNMARFNTTGMYHTGCSRSNHLESGINYLLFWEAIVGAKNMGLKWYEAGEMFPSAKNGKEKGLSDFKSKFGGELHRVFRGKTVVPEQGHAFPSSETAKKLQYRVVVDNWLSASRELLTIIIGKRAASMIAKIFSRFFKVGRV